MINQTDIDHMKELDIPQPIPVEKLNMGDLFSFVQKYQEAIFKVTDITDKTVNADGVTGIVVNYKYSFPFGMPVWKVEKV